MSEILEIKTDVASLRSLSPRESPGIVTIITEEEIKKSGAKDLLELLRTVSGYYFGTDILGIVGIVSRGLWSYEGKILLTLDGMELNEIAFGTSQIVNHYPVEQIKLIEIVRGPGSAIFGGFAGLGVINIVSKKGGDIKGAEVTANAGRLVGDYGHNYLSMLFGSKEGDLSASVGAFVGRSKFTDRDYTSFPESSSGDQVDLENGSRINPQLINANIEYKGFEVKLLQDYYSTTNLSVYGSPVSMESQVDFLTKIVSVKKKLEFGKVKIIPQFDLLDQQPFWNDDPLNDRSDSQFGRQRANQKTAKLIAEWAPTERLHFLIGSEKRWLEGQENGFFTAGDPPGQIINGPPYQSDRRMQVNAYFAQFMLTSSFANFTLGARHEETKHDSVKDIPTNTVPRFAITKVMEKFHFKLLLAKSYRAPTLSYYSFNTNVKPENITTSEVEIGYIIANNSFLALNIFDTEIKKPMAFGFDNDTGAEGYYNYEAVATRGAELEYKYVTDPVNVLVNYSYYQVRKAESDPIEPESTDKAFFGAPNHMAHLRLTYQVVKDLFLTPSAHYIGKIYSMKWDPELGDMAEFTLDPKTLFDLYVYSRDIWLKGLELGAGATNIFNVEEDFTQPYVKTGWHAPLPGPSREIYAKISYNSQF